MVYRAILVAAIVLVFSASLVAHKRIEEPARPESTPLWQCRRIVSMAPSITETLYALGLGDRVVGVTRYCSYPPDVKEKAKIGGYYDPNFEAIVALKPDLVVLLEEQAQSLPGFEKLKLETLVVCHKNVEGIIDSFRSIGRVCGKGPEGRRMAHSYEDRLGRIDEKMRRLPRPLVLLVLNRTIGCGHLVDVFVAGVDGYFDKLIELAGGQNVYCESGVRNPVVSPEGILRLNPDVIIDLVSPAQMEKHDRSAILADWEELRQLNAVKDRKVLVFGEDYDSVPGPRFIRLVEDLARALHPEVTWESGEMEDNE